MFSFAIINEVSFCASNFSKHLLRTCVKKEGQEILVTCSLAIPVGYSLATVSHSLASVGHSLTTVGYSLTTVGHSMAIVGHSLGTAGYSLATVGHSLTTVGYSLTTVGHRMAIVGHSLGTVGYSLARPQSGYSRPLTVQACCILLSYMYEFWFDVVLHWFMCSSDLWFIICYLYRCIVYFFLSVQEQTKNFALKNDLKTGGIASKSLSEVKWFYTSSRDRLWYCAVTLYYMVSFQSHQIVTPQSL